MFALVLPDRVASFRIESDDAVESRGHVKDTTDNDRNGFGRSCGPGWRGARRARRTFGGRFRWRFCGEVGVGGRWLCRGRRARVYSIELPCEAQLSDILRIDLLQRRVPLAARIMAEDWPIRLALRGRHDKQAKENERTKAIFEFHFFPKRIVPALERSFHLGQGAF